MKIKYILTIGLMVTLVSCAHTPPKENLQQITTSFKAQVSDGAPALKGRIVVQPFRSGEGVPADLEMGQASLMLVKGFTETVNKRSSDLQVVTDDRVSDANFFMKGYITRCIKSKGLVDHWRKKPNVFAVEGKIADMNSDRVLVSFSSSISSTEGSNFLDLAYQVGQRIAAYVIGEDKELP